MMAPPPWTCSRCFNRETNREGGGHQNDSTPAAGHDAPELCDHLHEVVKGRVVLHQVPLVLEPLLLVELNVLCQHTSLWMHAAPAADLLERTWLTSTLTENDSAGGNAPP